MGSCGRSPGYSRFAVLLARYLNGPAPDTRPGSRQPAHPARLSNLRNGVIYPFCNVAPAPAPLHRSSINVSCGSITANPYCKAARLAKIAKPQISMAGANSTPSERRESDSKISPGPPPVHVGAWRRPAKGSTRWGSGSGWCRWLSDCWLAGSSHRCQQQQAIPGRRRGETTDIRRGGAGLDRERSPRHQANGVEGTRSTQISAKAATSPKPWRTTERPHHRRRPDAFLF